MTVFTIANMDRDASDGFVTTVHWTASQTDGEYTASTYSTVGFTKTDDMNLIPFEEITEAQVIGWVKSALGEEQLASIDSSLANNIAMQKNPPVLSGTPWSNT